MQPELEVYTDQIPLLHREYTWPESEFYVSEKHRLVYCPIQKVACSSLKLWWAELVDGSSAPFTSLNEYGQTSVDHIALDTLYKFHHQSPSLGHAPLTEGDWLRVVFVRNPWARLVSAFVNKFVPLHDLAKPVFSETHLRWGNLGLPPVSEMMQRLVPWSCKAREEPLRSSIWPRLQGKKAWQDEFTFRHFVEYLATYDLNEDDIDLHWRPQYRFLGDVSFNFVGRFERLENDFQAMAKRLGIVIQLPSHNRTSYKRSRWTWGSYADCPLKKIRRLSSTPNYRQFYTRKLQDQVAELYHRDIEQFGYTFDS